MPISKPLQVVALRLDPEEKRRLAEMASSQNITLSQALREGARIYLEEAIGRSEVKRDTLGRLIQ